MDIKKITDDLDNFNIDDLEISKDDLTEIELKGIKKKVKFGAKIKRNKRKMIAVASAVLITGTMCTPAVAKNIPILNQIYEELGFFKGYEDKTTHIGITEKYNGYEITVEDMLASDEIVKVSIKIKSNKKIENTEFRVELGNIGVIGATSNSKVNRIDDYTVLITTNYSSTEGGYNKDDLFIIEVSEVKNNDINTLNYLKKFEVKADLKDIKEKKLEIKIDKQLSEDKKVVKLNAGEFKVTIDIEEVFDKYEKESNKVRELSEIIYDEEGNIKSGTEKELINEYNEKKYILENGTDQRVLLKIDDKVYMNSGATGNEKDNITVYDFNTIGVDDIKNAKSVEILYTDTTLYKNGIEDKFIKETEGNITYDKKIITINGEEVKGDLEIIGDKVRLSYNNNNDIMSEINLANTILYESNDIGGSFNEGTVYTNSERSYIEFDNVNLENEINIENYLNGDLAGHKVMNIIKVK